MRKVWGLVAGLATLMLAGCNLLRTEDAEGVPGRGGKAFDPYDINSGAIRLGLQMVNGCATLATGEPVGQGAPQFSYAYPANCSRDPLQPPRPAGAPPPPPMEVLTGSAYFLNQFTLVEYVTGVHTDPKDMSKVAQWLRTREPLAALDWSNLTVTSDSWYPAATTYAPGYYQHKVNFGDAEWMKVKNDTFLVEVLDRGGEVRNSITYSRADFLATDPSYGHTSLTWENDNVGAPLFPGDVEFRAPPPPPPGAFAAPPSYITRLRIDFHGAVNPQKQFNIPETLVGDGALRVTWSQLPNRPFHFPVRFIPAREIPLTCYSGADPSVRVPCTIGIEPVATLRPPANGQFYEPGETVHIRLGVKDGAGNYLHPLDSFPSWNEHVFNQANGLLYLNPLHSISLIDKDTITNWNVAGPRHLIRPYYELNRSPYYQSPSDVYTTGSIYGNDSGDTLVPPAAVFGFVPGGRDFHPSTMVRLTLPANVKPGTYILQWKVNRHFLGERLVKMSTFEFQVGDATRTHYSGRVGNCQICHRGPLSMENMTFAHGASIDEIEACTACHKRDLLLGGWEAIMLYQMHGRHMKSGNYRTSKADCTVCHLTRESTLRPSLIVCSSCHPQPHGGEYWKQALAPFNVLEPAESAFSNCAQSCHGDNPPAGHIVPK